MQLLEREAALSTLAGYAEDAKRGQGRLVLVTGEAGVGKTALVDQLERELPDARWSRGACDGLYTPRPLGPLFDLADQLGGRLLERSRAGAVRDDLFRTLLGQLSGSKELQVVVIEDVHWADEATIDLLRFLGRRIRDASVLIIVTYRNDGLAAGDPLRRVIGELGRHGSTRRIGLTSLSESAVGELASGSGLPAAELYRLTGGNPFFVTEVLQAGLGQVPESARDAVLARAVPLSAAAREVLDVTALAGRGADLKLLESVTGCPPSAIDELLTSGLLSEEDGGLRFRHEIARLAVEQSVGPHRRRRIHAKILAALLATDSVDDARIAFHAEGAGDGPVALRYARSAGQRASELGAHREAAAQFERALRFAATADTATTAQMYDAFAIEASLLDRWQEAVNAHERALRLWRETGDRLREGDTMRNLAGANWHLCRNEESIAGAEAALALLEPLGPTTELAWAYASLASSRLMNYRHEDAIALAQRAQATANELELPDVLSDALNIQGSAASNMDKEWTPQLHEALKIALSAGLDYGAARAYCNIYVSYCNQRRFAEAEQYYADGIAFCEEHDLTTQTVGLRGARAAVLEKTGRWKEAVALSEEILRGGGPSPTIRVGPLTTLGIIRARRNEPGAWEYLDEAIAYADQAQEAQQIVPVRLARAEARWLEGSLDEARHEAELADDMSGKSSRWDRGAVGVWLRRTGSSRAPQGDLAEPYQSELDGDWQEAASQWRDLNCPYDAALALLSAPDEDPLRAALAVFTDLDADPAARIARHKMRSLGIRSVPAGPRTTTRANPLGLTSREREVLALLCDGRTNAEIAGLLFLSVKTVNHHVSAILSKLGTPTRVAAAARAIALGLVEKPQN